MRLEWIEEDFSVCKIDAARDIPWEGVLFIGKTERELSLVCETCHAPRACPAREDGWSCFRVVGTLPFSLIGILSKLTGILAREQIGVFVVSTYDTDYILVKQERKEAAQRVLEKEGYEFLEEAR